LVDCDRQAIGRTRRGRKYTARYLLLATATPQTPIRRTTRTRVSETRPLYSTGKSRVRLARFLPVSTHLDSFSGRRVDSDDLFGAADVVAFLRSSHPSSVTTYLHCYADFPRPVVDLPASRVRPVASAGIESWNRKRTRA
jgi:hypothetical protein